MRHLDFLPSLPLFPTASKLYLAAECVAPWALGLPEVQDEPSEWAERGRRMHAIAEALSKNGMVLDASSELWSIHVADMVLRDRAAAKLSGDIMGAKRWYVEQGIRWRTDGLDDEVELCERSPGERLRGWFSGTADLVYVRHDGVLLVADWKFGAMEHLREPSEDSCQGFFLALAFASLLKIRGSSAGVVVARFEKRIVSEDGITIDGCDITQGELDQFAEQLRILSARIIAAKGAEPRISAACGHCKAKAECPAWESMRQGYLASWRDGVKDLTLPPANDEMAARMYYAKGTAESILSQWDEWIKAYVLTHPDGVSIGLGLKLKAIPAKDREVLDTPEALEVIERIAGPKAIEIQRKTGIGLIKAAARDSVDKSIKSTSDRDKSKKAAEERIFAELVEAGAVLDKGRKLTVHVVRSDSEG